MKRKHREWERISTCGGALISRVNKDLQNTKIPREVGFNWNWRWEVNRKNGGRKKNK